MIEGKFMRRIFLKKIFLVFALSIGCSGIANADDWGCQVLLCMANPNGATAVAACVPPIERLWNALKHGDGFPSCSFQDSQGNDLGPSKDTHASHQWANGVFCLPPYIVQNDDRPPTCSLAGAITVTINGSDFTRVWWRFGGDTVTEFNTANPDLAAQYQADLAAWQAQQSLIEQQKEEQANRGN